VVQQGCWLVEGKVSSLPRVGAAPLMAGQREGRRLTQAGILDFASCCLAFFVSFLKAFFDSGFFAPNPSSTKNDSRADVPSVRRAVLAVFDQRRAVPTAAAAPRRRGARPPPRAIRAAACGLAMMIA
jgi:hypothetical protein